MLQQGIELSNLDVTYVTSLSLYFLFLFGLSGVFSLILGDTSEADDTQLMQQQMSAAQVWVKLLMYSTKLTSYYVLLLKGLHGCILWTRHLASNSLRGGYAIPFRRGNAKLGISIKCISFGDKGSLKILQMYCPWLAITRVNLSRGFFVFCVTI